MALTPLRMPDYPRQASTKPTRPLRDRDVSGRIPQILGIPAQELMDALALACASGCALLFSPTSDGGALSITLYMGDARSRDYASSAEEFASTLVAVRDACEAHVIKSPTGLAKRPVGASQKP